MQENKNNEKKKEEKKKEEKKNDEKKKDEKKKDQNLTENVTSYKTPTIDELFNKKKNSGDVNLEKNINFCFIMKNLILK